MYNKEINDVKVQKDNKYLYFIDTEHPLAVGNSGKVYLHRHIASLLLGRWLTSEEHVHHIDGNKQNNQEDNLLVCSASEHSLIHQPALVPKECKNCGVSFLPKENTQVFCTHTCAHKYSIKNKKLTKELLDDLIPKHTWVELGKMFGYSDNGIKKRARALGCVIPVRKARVV